MASKYAVLIALATVSAVAVDSGKGNCVGNDCNTDLYGASFVGRTGEISHLGTHSNTGALSFAQQQVQQAKTMMVAANKMAQTALDSINSAHRLMRSIAKGRTG
ncbi:unnamed protein product [Vitrella brassicaformis CCMP3155]|uniref:Uncharacterized protein n=1 Tax=Vitrella brassicaformis (strain CCMP3155) TaxID=1169540 RepID=A0A0G4F0W2_VITBC|nr:unnamed protein product [Vitrella brassicaformis CCMP3155]|eukprot:CEM04760.1 unnamed protein product [Vitrella brassicaformis CCMP3155]